MVEDDNVERGERSLRWSLETLVYEIGFRVALFFIIGVLSYSIFSLAGVFGGPSQSAVAAATVFSQ